MITKASQLLGSGSVKRGYGRPRLTEPLPDKFFDQHKLLRRKSGD